MIRRAVFFLVIIYAGIIGTGFVPDRPLSDSDQENQAQYIISQLRCFVCQGQPLAQSDAPLARDLRRLVRDKIAEGKNTGEIIGFITSRYGDDVLLNPPFNRRSFVLWLLPFFILIMGGVFLWRRFFHKRI